MDEQDLLLNLSLQQFLADAAHDLRQPLNAVQMYLGILQRQSIDVDHEVSQIVGDSLRAMQANINLLTNWARVEQNALKSVPEMVDSVMWSARLHKEGVIEWTQNSQPPKGQDQFDLALATATLRDMTRLLPADQICQRSDALWGLSINTGKVIYQGMSGQPQFIDQLYQLALVAGGTILQQLGFELQLERQAEGYHLLVDRP